MKHVNRISKAPELSNVCNCLALTRIELQTRYLIVSATINNARINENTRAKDRKLTLIIANPYFK